MKYLKTLAFLYCSFVLFSCTNNVDHLSKIDAKESNFLASIPIYNTPNYSTTDLIVQYNTGVSNTDKVFLRQHYNVVSYEVCDHCDGTIEKWIFDNNVNLEHKVGAIQSGSGDAEMILGVDMDFDFEDEDEGVFGGGSGDYEYVSKIVPANNGVTIAILDSGIDAHYSILGDTSFLYNASMDTIPEVQSGWNYVNHSENTYDNNDYLHGTAVGYLIHAKLEDLSIPHQILPVKVAASNGSASYFNMLCGISFSAERADIIQMSLGWYDTEDPDFLLNDIFSNLIEKYKDEVLFITSAGNNANNNDGEGVEHFLHYPSSYSLDNILAIASANVELDDIAYFSNYGLNSVDFFAPGENILFYTHSEEMGEEEEVLISGTSFSAPIVAAKASKILYDSGMLLTPEQVINSLKTEGFPIIFSNPVKYNKLILIED